MFKDEPCNFVSQMYLDDDPPIAAGREIWGFPKKWGQPKLAVATDTLTGTLHYSGQLVAMGTMGYKHETQHRPKGVPAGYPSVLGLSLRLVPAPVSDAMLRPLASGDMLRAPGVHLIEPWSAGLRHHHPRSPQKIA